MRGRKPIPDAIKAFTGKRGKLGYKGKVSPRRGRPTCPRWLDRVARAKWKALLPELDRLGLLTVVDGDALAAYCVAWSELKAATMLIQEEGRVCHCGTGGLKPHPAIALQRSALNAIAKFSSLFGLNPADRGRIAAPQKPENQSLLEDFMAS